MSYATILKTTALLAGMAVLACHSGTGTAQNAAPKNTDTVNLKYTVEEAPEWNALFTRTSGWFGADGIYAIPLDGARNKSPKAGTTNMFIFSDTMVGDIVDGKIKDSKMVHNSVAYLKGGEPKKENITFDWARGTDGKPDNLFHPSTKSTQPGDYYWLGDAIYNPAMKKTYIFAYRMHNMDSKDDWSFREMGTTLIAIPKGSKPPFKDQQQIETPFHFPNDGGGIGAGIMMNTKESGALHPDGYIYVYGSRTSPQDKGLIVSRVLPKDFENFSAWRYYDGKEWVAEKEKAAILATNISNELSVTALPDGRYVLVYQLGGMSPTVALKIGLSPVGPFGPPKKLYDAKVQDPKMFTYNAKAHPSLSAPGELLISYNQNSWDFWKQLEKFPNLYHPHFLKLKFN